MAAMPPLPLGSPQRPCLPQDASHRSATTLTHTARPWGDWGRGGRAAVAHRQQNACSRPGPEPRLLGPAGILGAAPHPKPRSRLLSHQASTRPAWCCPRVVKTVGEQPLTGSSGMSTEEEGAEPTMCQVMRTSRPPEDTDVTAFGAAGAHGESEWAEEPPRRPQPHPDLAPSVQLGPELKGRLWHGDGPSQVSPPCPPRADTVPRAGPPARSRRCRRGQGPQPLFLACHVQARLALPASAPRPDSACPGGCPPPAPTPRPPSSHPDPPPHEFSPRGSTHLPPRGGSAGAWQQGLHSPAPRPRREPGKAMGPARPTRTAVSASRMAATSAGTDTPPLCSQATASCSGSWEDPR